VRSIEQNAEKGSHEYPTPGDDTMTSESPKVLIVYYSYTKTTEQAALAMAARLTERGADVTTSSIAFTDEKFAKGFQKFPQKYPIPKIFRMLPLQARKKTGTIGVAPEANSDAYDFVIVGSPTWWLTTCMPVRSYLHDPASKTSLNGKHFAAFSVSRRYWKGNMHTIESLGEKNGGTWEGETHFVSYGNQVTSMWSWLEYMRHAKPVARSFGKKLPPPNLKPDFGDQAIGFVDELADRLLKLAPAGPA
jgi:flavodoxin